MHGPSDIYGDMSLEDVDEFEGLEPDNHREIDPMGVFERGEIRSFDRDFDEELGYEYEDGDKGNYDSEDTYSDSDSFDDEEEYYEDEYEDNYSEDD